MTPAEIETYLTKRFMVSDVKVAVKLEPMQRGEALAIRWERGTRRDRGCFFTACDSRIDEIVLDLEHELTCKERGA
jgi:hypothetical protein